MDNLRLWDRYSGVPTEYHERYTTLDGHPLEAIDAYFLIRAATEEWGPYGDLWGLQCLKWSTREWEDPVEVLDAEFYYPSHAKSVRFPLSVDMIFEPGCDTRKKMITSAIKKGLSYLGFGGDAFLGKFDDRDYKRETSDEDKTMDTFRKFLELATLHEELDKLAAWAYGKYNSGQIDKAAYAEAVEAITKKRDNKLEERDEDDPQAG